MRAIIARMNAAIGPAIFNAAMLMACTAAKPAPPVAAAPDPDAAACVRLCDDEARCAGSARAACSESCAADVRRMKAGFVARYVECFAPALRARCGAFDDDARNKAHERCFDETLARYARDDRNQRDMAEAVCDRGERCQGLGKEGRAACMQATLDPKEPEVKLGQHLVDALRRERVVEFRSCVDQAPCSDGGAVDGCYARVLARGS